MKHAIFMVETAELHSDVHSSGRVFSRKLVNIGTSPYEMELFDSEHDAIVHINDNRAKYRGESLVIVPILTVPVLDEDEIE